MTLSPQAIRDRKAGGGDVNFAVIVRSIGERSEGLALQSAELETGSKAILLSGFKPSYRVYEKMFQTAVNSDFDWFLALDADTVLFPGWLTLVNEKISQIKGDETFKFFYKVYDPIFHDIRGRGHHIYNRSHIEKAIAALSENVSLINSGWLKRMLHSREYILKPESSLKHRMRKKYGLKTFMFPEVAGVHGAQQYFSEIIRTFIIRANREPSLEREYAFLRQKQPSDLDRLAAKVGWDFGLKRKVDAIDSGNADVLKKLMQENGLVEKGKIDLSYGDFVSKYRPLAEGFGCLPSKR